jgi:hypothetical protein
MKKLIIIIVAHMLALAVGLTAFFRRRAHK